MSKALLILLSAVVVIAGCSVVNVRKVPTPTQYVQWSDEDQRQADAIKGFRFYLPRPFINVFESFPIRTDIYLAKGKMSEDGKSISIQKVMSIDGFSETGDTTSKSIDWGADFKIDSKWVVVKKQNPENRPSSPAFQGQSGSKASAPLKSPIETLESTLNVLSDADVPIGKDEDNDTSDSNNPDTSNEQSPSSDNFSGGITKEAISNNNFAFAYQPMRGNFDIAYLPDFEEQYAIEKREGLGNVEFALNLGQGWSLQSYNALVDNSALNERILSLLDTAGNAAKLALGDSSPIVDSVSQLSDANNVFAAESGVKLENLLDKKQADLSKDITLKIVVVHYAAKGLYPVIKPRELQHRILNKEASTITTNISGNGPRSTNRNRTSTRPDEVWFSRYDETQIKNNTQAYDNVTGHSTVPYYPYQFISFNTFRYLAIEMIDGTSQPFGELYDRTGTKGAPDASDSGNLESILKFVEFANKQNQPVNITSAPPSNNANTQQSETCGDKQTDLWSKQYQQRPLVFAGTEKNGLNVFQPAFLSGVFSGDIRINAPFDLTTEFSTEKAIKDQLKKTLQNDMFLQAIGCKDITLGHDLSLSANLQQHLKGEAKSCQSDSTDSLFTCVLQTPFPVMACNSQFNLTFDDYKSSHLTISVAPPEGKTVEQTLCNQAITNSFTSPQVFANELLTFIRNQQKATTGSKQLPLVQTLEIKNLTEIEKRYLPYGEAEQ